MANNIRRYQPRRSSGASPWLRFVLIGITAVVLVFIGRAVFMGGKDNSGETNEPKISLVNETSNTNSTNTNSTEPINGNSNLNTNADVSGLELTTIPDDACEAPISKYGSNKVAVLTFEMSAANENAADLLALLKKDKIPASFFSTGTFAEKNPDFLRDFVDSGYAVYNRGYDSTNLTTLTAEQIPVQLTKAAVAIEAATGLAPTPFLRPAQSATNDTVFTAAKEAGYCVVLGTVDATDWQDGVTAAAAVDRVMGKLTPGMIVQLHAGYDITNATVTGLAAELRTAGYSLVTLSTLLNS